MKPEIPRCEDCLAQSVCGLRNDFCRGGYACGLFHKALQERYTKKGEDNGNNVPQS